MRKSKFYPALLVGAFLSGLFLVYWLSLPSGEDSRPAPEVAAPQGPAEEESDRSYGEDGEPLELPLVERERMRTGFGELEDFPEETRFLVEAIERGQAVTVSLGEGSTTRWAFRPTPAMVEEFVVSASADDARQPVARVYRGMPLERRLEGGDEAFLSVVGNRMAAMVFRDGDILYLRQTEAGSWEMEREAIQAGAWRCSYVGDGAFATVGDPVMVPYQEESWGEIGIEPDWAASDGENPLTGEVTRTERRIPYGPQYAASLRTVLGVMVNQGAGSNTEANIAAKTAEYLTLAASLNAMFENQLGMNYLLQELILLVSGADFIGDPGSDLWVFRGWMQNNRHIDEYQWSVASKVGSVSGANGWAYLRAAGRVDGININNRPGFTLIGHEIGHNLGTNHTSGGIMNGSSGNTARDFFRMKTSSSGNSTVTGAKRIWDYMSASTTDGPRSYGNALLRNPAEMPFANDNKGVTQAGQPLELDVLSNDLTQVMAGAENTQLTIVETGAVFPPQAGTATHSEDRVVFTPAPGFAGVAFFTYTLRGNVGNNGNGWLHKGDVAVVVENPGADAPVVTATRGPAATHHDNERVILRWDPMGNRAGDWEIERAVNGAPFMPVAVVDGAVPHWIDLRIHGSSAVRYRIRAADNGGGPGAWGYSETLPAFEDAWAFWEEFSAGHLTAWETWSNDPSSVEPDDAETGRFSFTVENGQAVLESGSLTENRLGLLVRPQLYDLAVTGDLTLAADLRTEGGRQHRRVIAWLDDGGGVIWLGVERSRTNNRQRSYRLYAAESLETFFREVGDYESVTQIFENSQGTRAGFVDEHRASLTVSTDGVAMTVVSESFRDGAAGSTLGLIDHGLSNFTGVGRFAVGGLSNPSEDGPTRFRFDNIGITSHPVPVKYLPALLDDYIEVNVGESKAFNPFANDLWLIDNKGIQSSSPEIRVFSQRDGRDLYAVQAVPGTPTGVYEVIMRARGNSYEGNNDGLTNTSTVYVQVVDRPAQANLLELYHYRGDPPLDFFPLGNDFASGHAQLSHISPRTGTSESGSVTANAHYLVSADLLTGSLGSLHLHTMPAVIGGSLQNRNSGMLTFSRGNNVHTGTAEISYTFEDSRGESDTGTVLIHLLRADAPRILGHPLGQSVTRGNDVALTVSAQGSGLSYQWFRNNDPIPDATGSELNVISVDSADAGTYHVEVSNSDGMVRSDPAEVVVSEPLAGDLSVSAIADQETDFETPLTGISFTVWDTHVPLDDLVITASSSNSILLPDSGISFGGVGETRTLNLAPASGQSGETVIYLSVSNGVEEVSTSFQLTVNPDPAVPEILLQAESLLIYLGEDASFFVQAEGFPEPDYQWLLDGSPVPGATSPRLSLSPTVASDAGTYTLEISNSQGTVTSDPVTLSFVPVPAAPLSLQGEATSPRSVFLEWDAADSLHHGFRIERSTSSEGPWVLAGETAAEETSFDDVEAEPLASYLYRVRAWNPSGESLPSGEVLVSTPSAPTGPLQMDITLSGYSGSETLAEFPLLVRLSTEIPGFSYEDFESPEGHDLRFFTADGETELPYEVEIWNPQGESIVWVRVPEVSGSETTVRMKWNDPDQTTQPGYVTDGSVWAGTFASVWHLGEESGSRLDAGPSGRHAQVHGPVQQVEGIVGYASLMDGSDGGTALRAGEHLYPEHQFTDAFHLEGWMWIHPGADIRKRELLSQEDTYWGGRGYRLGFDNEQARIAIGVEAGASSGDGREMQEVDYPGGVPEGEWFHVATSWEDGTIRTYFNGVLAQESSFDHEIQYEEEDNLPLVLGAGWFGQNATQNRSLDGRIDEIRVGSTARSGDWIAATYQNIAETDTFLSFGEVESQINVPPPVAPENLTSPEQTDTTISLTWTHSGEGELDGFRVYRSEDAVGGMNEIVMVFAETFSFTDTGLTPETIYYYEVRAFNSGGVGEPSNRIGVSTGEDTREEPVINDWPTASGLTYGQTLSDATLSGGEAGVDGSFAFAEPGLRPDAGTAPQAVVFLPEDTATYQPVSEPVNVTVDPAVLVVVADDQRKAFGEEDPELTWTLTEGELLDGDVLSGELTRESGEALGEYAIQPGTLSAGPNYTISFVPGTLTIEPGEVTIVLNRPTVENVRIPEGVGLVLETEVTESGAESGLLTLLWEKTGGEGSVSWEATDTAETVAWFSAQGEYTLRLTAENGTHSEVLEIAVEVVNPPGTSQGNPAASGFVSIPTENLALYLPLDESSGSVAGDLSGNDRDATLSGSPEWRPEDGVFGGALRFTGSGQYAVIADSDGLDGVAQMSWSWWMRPDADNSNVRGVLSKRANVNSEQAWSFFLHNNNGLNFDIPNSGTRLQVGTIPADEWTHVAVVFDGSQPSAERVRVYWNGEFDNIYSTGIDTLPDRSSAVVIGLLDTGDDRNFRGDLDEIAIYRGRALTAEDVAVLFEGGS
ncbi:MAG: DUF2341 domain-containing protein, partial [Opitutales bacterium]|nr:DUF2341 domain-containing protein [Opitutales bacterium]